MSDNLITVTIDGIECKAQEGEYILNVARANDIFIPAICYLTRCSPTLACRICLVDADGKRVYSCNAKVKDGMDITTQSEEILEERRAIMEVYDVNHPLQCGVCDQHGECELQNYTLELGVDSQNFAIADTKRGNVNWSSVLHYDAGLCIVCERCVTVCKDMIGDAAIKTGPRGGDKLPKELKDSMPKDAYSMWNKLQKSVIIPSNGTEHTNCSDCGECTAVCPVGALTERDFIYKANPWDLKEIPSACAHCSSACHIYYETRAESINNPVEKIFRVKNEWHYQTLCGAGRFGYDYENIDVKKDPAKLNAAIEAFKKADVVKFNSMITNEEALMLQSLKEKFNFKLVNQEVKPFKDFLAHYSNATGRALYKDSFKDMSDCDLVISIGSKLRNDNPAARYLFNNIQKMNKGAGFYFHPVGDTLIPTFGKSVMSFEHKVGDEELALLFIIDILANKDKLPDDIKEKLASFKENRVKVVTKKVMEDVTEVVVDKESGEEKEVTKKVPKNIKEEVEYEANTLAERLGANAETLEDDLAKALKKKESFALILGEDLYYHKRAKNIANLVALLEESCDIKVAFIPPKSNALGVALICDLDEDAEGYSVGYNEEADFKLSALGDGDLDIPAMNQQEGTITNMNKRVVPLNAALEYGGYELNDILNKLGFDNEFTIEWTAKLPLDKGFQVVEFDDLSNSFGNDKSENRGYVVANLTTDKEGIKLDELEDITLDGDIAYRCNPQRQFNDFTDKAHQIFEKFALYASKERADELGEWVRVDFENGGALELPVEVDERISGNIVEIPDFKADLDVYGLFGKSRYSKVTITKV
jgi:NADH-quinone oxidoreductase subunit G